MKGTYVLALSLLAFASCSPQGEAEDPVTAPLTPVAARSQLIRLSVDLRGVHPSEVELRAYEANPALWDTFVTEWLDDPRFLGRMREVFNQRFLTRTGETFIDPEDRGLAGVNEGLVADYVGDEPLRLLTHVIENDLPYRTMVTADYSMANPTLARMWGMDYPEGAAGWQPSHYRDGRPHAGMLSMKTVWARYPSMGGNANRHRANAISKMFLCDDYLSRPIVLSRAAVDQLTTDPENAIRTNISCQSCHNSLDPLSANFFGYWNYDDDEGFSSTIYRPEREEEWRNYAGREPGYYGTPVSDLTDLGELLANDQRFVDCAVQTVFEGLTQRTVDDRDWEEITPHTNEFVANNQSIKALVRSIVNSPEYVAGAARDPDVNDRLATVKTASPEQLASIIEGITGYTWTMGGRSLLGTNDRGMPVLVGGIDSRFVVTPNYVPSVGTAFAQERLAQSAGYYVASRDLAADREGPARLLRFVTIEDTPDSNPDAFEAQIRALYVEITGEVLAPDAVEPAELVELWKYLYSVEASPVRAWAGIVSVVLRDPRVLFY